MKITLPKMKNIELLRFLFILIIVCCHLKHGVINCFYETIPFYSELKNCFSNSTLPVEFFFIMSGFFLFLTTDFSQRFQDFAKNKLIRFMPLVLFSLICWFVGTIFLPMSFSGTENVFTILNIQNIGLTTRNGNVPASWYISSLFWTMCFYFYFFKICEKRWFNLVTACVVLFCYSLWLHTEGINYLNVGYVFNRGMIRAFAGIGLGYFIAMVYRDNIENIKQMVLDKKQKFLISLSEFVLLFFIVFNTSMHKLKYDNKFIFIIAFVGLFWLFIIKKGYLSNLLDNDFSVKCGKIAFGIFLTHQFIIKVWSIVVCDWNSEFVLSHPYMNLVLLFVVIIAFGALSHYKVEVPVVNYLKNKK